MKYWIAVILLCLVAEGCVVGEDTNHLKNAGTFNQGYAFTGYLAAVALDQKWHTIPDGLPLLNTDSFEEKSLTDLNLWLTQAPPRYRSSYFLHIWANGYSAAYYAYSWAEMLGHDAYAWFEENGGLKRENGQYFREKNLISWKYRKF